MKNKIIKISLILFLLFAGLAITKAVPVIAQEGEVPVAGPSGEEAREEEQLSIVICPEVMGETIKQEEEAFTTFIDAHFQNELENSVLLEQAMERYRLAKINLENKFQEFGNQGLIPEVLAGTFTCQTLINDSLDRMRILLKTHAIETAYGKQGLKITDKYKAINQKLRDLNFQVSEMRAYFYSFNNLLPSFTPQCGS